MRTYGLFLPAALFAAGASLLTVGGCDKHPEDRTERAADRAGATVHKARDKAEAREDRQADKADEREAARHEADNTGVNARDRTGNLPTAMDQSDDKEDLALVQAIRKAVVADDTLSMTAKNVKIIVRDGKVILRGPVHDEAERKAIRNKSVEIAGKGNVEDLLDVETRPAGSREPTVPQPVHTHPTHKRH